MTLLSAFTSNTAAAGGNQYIFPSGPQPETGRVFYRITQPGTYSYSFAFSATVDSTFADGSISRCNLRCPEWRINSCRVAVCSKNSIGADFMEPSAANRINERVTHFWELTFRGATEATVGGTDPVYSDPVSLTLHCGEYLCLEIVFQGSLLPCHEESLLPVYRLTGGSWCYDKRVPLPQIAACDRPVKARIGFWGDSITQGIGTAPNSYRHWCALVAQRLSEDYACWNLGLGYGRAADAASDGVWMQKALQNDVVCVCFGVNDILQGASAELLKRDLHFVVTRLKSCHKRVLLQTVPPFDYGEQHRPVWKEVNRYILEELSGLADGFFDNVPLLSVSPEEAHRAKYGGHPNEEGCGLWAEAITEKITEILSQEDYP